MWNFPLGRELCTLGFCGLTPRVRTHFQEHERLWLATDRIDSAWDGLLVTLMTLLVLCMSSQAIRNRDVIRGYGSVHIPVVPGAHEVEVPMFRPLSVSRLPRAMTQMLTCLPQSSLLQQFIGWIHATPAGSV